MTSCTTSLVLKGESISQLFRLKLSYARHFRMSKSAVAFEVLRAQTITLQQLFSGIGSQSKQVHTDRRVIFAKMYGSISHKLTTRPCAHICVETQALRLTANESMPNCMILLASWQRRELTSQQSAWPFDVLCLCSCIAWCLH